MTEERRSVIYQANPLIEGRQPFGTIEMRLFLLALQHVNPHVSNNDRYYDEAFKELYLTPVQVKEIFGHGEYLKILEGVCDNMMKKVITVRSNEGGFIKYSLFGRIEYKPKEGLWIKFDNEMRPLILDIIKSGGGYTKLDAKQLFNLHSAYAVRLLELMLQYRGMMINNVITRHIELEELRFFMDVEEGKYKQTGSFVQTIVEAPVKDINQSTEYELSYEKTKTGRKITGFTFHLNCSAIQANEDRHESVKLEVIPSPKNRHGLSKKIVNQLTTICGSNEEFELRMEHALKLAEERKPDNLQGFLYNAIKENYRQQDLDTQAAIERELKAIEENNEWEQAALKMFSGEIQTKEDRPEIPFDLTNPIEAVLVKIIKKSLKERKLGITEKSRLEEHNMSIPRFLELYGKV